MVKGQTGSIFALLTALISGTGMPFVTINTSSQEAPTSGMESTAFHSQLDIKSFRQFMTHNGAYETTKTAALAAKAV